MESNQDKKYYQIRLKQLIYSGRTERVVFINVVKAGPEGKPDKAVHGSYGRTGELIINKKYDIFNISNKYK